MLSLLYMTHRIATPGDLPKEVISMKFMISVLCLMTASLAFAAGPNGVRLGHPSYGGNGCPQGTASAALSPDAQSLSILFDEFSAEAGGENKRTVRKGCNIAIPVHVPGGYSVSIFKIDYRGFNDLPRGAWSRFGVEYFFAGSRGPKFRKTFRGPLSDDFTLNNTLRGTAKSYSRCGEDVNLRINASIMAKVRNRRQEAIATVDSADVKSSLVYHLAWRRC